MFLSRSSDLRDCGRRSRRGGLTYVALFVVMKTSIDVDVTWKITPLWCYKVVNYGVAWSDVCVCGGLRLRQTVWTRFLDIADFTGLAFWFRLFNRLRHVLSFSWKP